MEKVGYGEGDRWAASIGGGPGTSVTGWGGLEPAPLQNPHEEEGEGMVSMSIREGESTRDEIPCSVNGVEDTSPEGGDRDPLNNVFEDKESEEGDEDVLVGED